MKKIPTLVLLMLITCSAIYSSSFNLPVIFDSVQVQLNGAYIEVTWHTTNQVNNDFFVVERSTDSIVFNTVGYVDGAGTNGSVIDYSFIDSTANTGTNYFYRIRQVDFGGTYTNSIIVSYYTTLGMGDENIELVQSNLYPNPSIGMVTLSLAETISNIDFFLFDLSGQALYTRKDLAANGHKFDFTFLAAGTYIYQLRTNDKVVSRGTLIKE